MFRLQRPRALWSGIVFACAFVRPLFSGHQTGGRTVGTATTDGGDSANGIAVLFTQDTPPAFRTAVNLLTIDVQVVAPQGKPIPALTAEQFDVRIAGRQRKVVFAELLHMDEGAVTQGPRIPTDAATRAACAFGFERSSRGANAHYLVGVEPSDSDKGGIKRPKVKVYDRALTVRRWAWRSRVALPLAPAPGLR